MYLLKLMVARIRLRIHCYLYLHEPQFFHHDTPEWSVIYLVRCKFCARRVYYRDVFLIEQLEKERQEKEQRVVANALGRLQ